jgi:hypothetical protein
MLKRLVVWLGWKDLKRRLRQLDVSVSLAEADLAKIAARRRGRR